MIGLVGVVVPAANEQDLVGGCLDALADARTHLQLHHPGVRVRVVVVLDSCTDATAELVRARHGIESRTISRRCVGAARSAGARQVLERTALPYRDVWLANTDADSRVRPDWLSAMLDVALQGADLLLGTVLPEPGLPARVERSWRAEHQLRDGHPHVHGANFGIRADAYATLGGWPDLPTGEDVALARRAASAGHLTIVRSAAHPVRTSVRSDGRAPRGFSSHLRGIAAG